MRLFERKQDGSITAGKSFQLAGYRSAVDKILRPNASLISTLAQLDHPLALLGRQLATTIFSNLLIEKVETTEDVIVRHYAANPNLLQSLNREIERVDLGIRRIRNPDGTERAGRAVRASGIDHASPGPTGSHRTRT